MILLLQYTLIFASVLLLVALGGCFSEHSGVINIGLEGIMVMGALGGALMMKFLPESTPAIGMIVLVVLAATLFGLVYSLLLAVAAINFKADQTLVGTAMNLLGTAAASQRMDTPPQPAQAEARIKLSRSPASSGVREKSSIKPTSPGPKIPPRFAKGLAST